MAGIQIEVVGHKKLKDTLAKLSGIDSVALLRNVEAVIDSDLMQRFELGHDPSGKKWVESERAINEGGKTLVDRGHLRDSFHGDVISGEELIYGSDEKYVAIHQFGGVNGRNHKNVVEARPMLGITGKQLRLIDNAIDDFTEALLA